MSEEIKQCHLKNKDQLSAIALTQIGQNALFRSIPALEQCTEVCDGPSNMTIPRSGWLAILIPHKVIEVCPLEQ